MADPTVSTPFDTPDPLLKTRYATPKKRRWARESIHKARGFGGRTLKGRLPLRRPPKRGG